jgi:hypothetical protein
VKARQAIRRAIRASRRACAPGQQSQLAEDQQVSPCAGKAQRPRSGAGRLPWRGMLKTAEAPEAADELVLAMTWYDAERDGLGLESYREGNCAEGI